MQELISTTLKSEAQTIGSREIAHLTGKEHRSVLRDIDNLNESYEKLGLHKIVQGYYTHPNTGKQEHREMLLNKIQTMDLMTGYNLELRIKVNRRWEELEAKEQHRIPQSFSDALKLAYEQSLKIESQQRQLDYQKPLVTFAEALQISEHCILIGELAKILKQNGISIGQNRLFDKLRSTGYLMKSGEQRNLPTQKSLELGLFEVKTTTINNPDGSVRVTHTTKVSPKGQQYFVNRFIKKELQLN